MRRVHLQTRDLYHYVEDNHEDDDTQTQALPTATEVRQTQISQDGKTTKRLLTNHSTKILFRSLPIK